jgi:hypothetical protein
MRKKRNLEVFDHWSPIILSCFSHKQAAKMHQAVFFADHTHNLITRLHHNVIRTGLRRINLAYSRISLQV